MNYFDGVKFDVYNNFIILKSHSTKLRNICYTYSDGCTCSMDTNVAMTGSIIAIKRYSSLHSQFTVIVEGDTNGDSICDVLDCALVERTSSGNAQLDGVFAMAGDLNSDGVIDSNDYQSIINQSLI